jgi:DNA-directed RNA polymerase sigma subunit (sigma70/sigma32)
MTRKREFASDPSTLEWTASTKRPTTPMQALMQAAPGQPIETSQMELLGLREVLSDAFDQLTSEEQWLLNALLIEKRPLRRLARESGIPKTSLARIRDTTLAKLRASLSDDTVIVDYLERYA